MNSSAATSVSDSRREATRAGEYRHTRLVRITHWINAASFLFLVPSGVAILIAHPELYWGETGYFGEPAFLTFPVEPNFNHTAWGRGMHFFFAWVLVINGLVYLASGLLNGHFRRKFMPAGHELRPRHVLHEFREHVRLRTREQRENHQTYNVLQKIAYLVVVFVLLPLMLLTGLAMSPALVAAFPDFFALFGGRQTARTLHFIAATLLLLFLLVHILKVFFADAAIRLRAMTSGKFLPESEDS